MSRLLPKHRAAPQWNSRCRVRRQSFANSPLSVAVVVPVWSTDRVAWCRSLTLSSPSRPWVDRLWLFPWGRVPLCLVLLSRGKRLWELSQSDEAIIQPPPASSFFLLSQIELTLFVTGESRQCPCFLSLSNQKRIPTPANKLSYPGLDPFPRIKSRSKLDPLELC